MTDNNAQAAFDKLLTEQQSLILATVNADGSPLASYTPFAIDADKNFYIFVSTLSQHTNNLQRTWQASLMLIADEATSALIFARLRVTLACQVRHIDRKSDLWQTAAALYEARFIDMFGLINGFRDFQMFCLTPENGSIVLGFGEAYEISGDQLSRFTQRSGM